jgi:methylated-DNA-protein-cysteine methyltransferase-like protein
MANSPQPESDAVAAAILDVVARIPRGRVTTYGAVAQRAGQPRRARLVGRVLSRLPAGSRVPWHRVVAAGGRIAFPDGSAGRERQIARLRREGVMVANGCASLRKYGWGSPGDSVDRWLWQVGDDPDRH